MTELESLKSFGKLKTAIKAQREMTPVEIGRLVNNVLDEALSAEVWSQLGSPSRREIYKIVLDQMADYFESVSYWANAETARDNLVSYARVARFFTAERLKKIGGHPTYCQLRACLVKSPSWWEYPEQEIMSRVEWAKENGWPTVKKIEAKFASSPRGDEEELSEDDKYWIPLDHAIQVAYDKAVTYLEATKAERMDNPVIVTRRLEAQKLVNLFSVPVYEVAKWD